MQTLKWILPYIKRIKFGMGLALILILLETFTSVTLISIQRNIIDDIFIQGNYDRLAAILTHLAGAAALYVILIFLVPILNFQNQFRLFTLLHEQLSSHIQKIPIGDFQKERYAKIINVLTNDTLGMSSSVADYLPKLARALIRAVTIIIVVASFSPVLSAAAVIFSVVNFMMGLKFGAQLRKVNKEMLDRRSDVFVQVERSISSTREVLAYNRIHWESKLFHKAFGKYYEKVVEEGNILNRQLLVSEPVKWAPLVFAMLICGYQVIMEQMSVGTFFILYQFLTMLMSALNDFYQNILQVSKTGAFIDRTQTMLEARVMEDGLLTLQDKIICLEFSKVRFKYQEELEESLKGIDLQLPIGKKVAIVGASGSGKSTIAQLLVRFFDPTNGAMLVNGVETKRIRREDWAQKVSVVMQDPYIFADSIRNNLVLGREGISQSRMDDVIMHTQIGEFANALPGQIDYVIGERGITLSGGQKQRIAIGRALLGEPELLVMDEATSALDVHTEYAIQQYIDSVRKGKTTIIIAHRLSTIRNADRIIVMENGCVVEEGTHETLLEKNGKYTKLVEAEGFQKKSEMVSEFI